MHNNTLKNIIKIFLLLAIANNCFAEKICIPEKQWFIPKTGDLFTFEQYLSQMPSQGILLLGEHHENKSHHRWQLNVLKALHNKQANMAIGLEMFPQYLQPVIDQWLENKISNETFILRSQWQEVWAYDFADYLPLFQFAKDNHIPLFAINVQKALLQMSREVGWKNIPVDHRQGISNPAQPSKNYLRQLATSFQRHYPPDTKIDKHAFFRFVEQQLIWDRAMAQGLANRKADFDLIVGILGSGHIINDFGVPHQLRDLKQRNITSYIPWDENLDCGSISSQFADAIFSPATL